MRKLYPSEQVDVDHQQLQELSITGDADGCQEDREEP